MGLKLHLHMQHGTSWKTVQHIPRKCQIRASRRYWNYVRDKRLQVSFFFLIDKSHMQLVGFELIISHPPPCSYKGREFHLSKSSLAEDHSMSSSSKHNKKYLNLGKILFKINFKQEQKWQPLHYGTSGW